MELAVQGCDFIYWIDISFVFISSAELETVFKGILSTEPNNSFESCLELSIFVRNDVSTIAHQVINHTSLF
jgi:hypothetical protein